MVREYLLIHLPLFMWPFFTKNVGKYPIPMDPMVVRIHFYSFFRTDGFTVSNQCHIGGPLDGFPSPKMMGQTDFPGIMLPDPLGPVRKSPNTCWLCVGFGSETIRSSIWFGVLSWNKGCKNSKPSNNKKLGGGFEYFLCSPLFGEDSHFDYI